jgi:hypothetical protein
MDDYTQGGHKLHFFGRREAQFVTVGIIYVRFSFLHYFFMSRREVSATK